MPFDFQRDKGAFQPRLKGNGKILVGQNESRSFPLAKNNEMS
jgi:hypothetical protein